MLPSYLLNDPKRAKEAEERLAKVLKEQEEKYGEVIIKMAEMMAEDISKNTKDL